MYKHLTSLLSAGLYTYVHRWLSDVNMPDVPRLGAEQFVRTWMHTGWCMKRIDMLGTPHAGTKLTFFVDRLMALTSMAWSLRSAAAGLGGLLAIAALASTAGVAEGRPIESSGRVTVHEIETRGRDLLQLSLEIEPELVDNAQELVLAIEQGATNIILTSNINMSNVQPDPQFATRVPTVTAGVNLTIRVRPTLEVLCTPADGCNRSGCRDSVKRTTIVFICR